MAVQDLIMFITNRCNLKCDYCCVNANSLQEELSVEEIKEAIDIIKPTRVIHLTGGEPFLRYDDVVELAHYAWTKVPVIVINTNGTIHDIDLTKILPPDDKRQCNLIVSLDGFKENHDLHCGVENTFEKVLEFSKKAIDIGLNVQVKATLPNSLLNDEEYCKNFVFFCNEFGFSRVMLGNIFNVGRGTINYEINKEIMTTRQHIALMNKVFDINHFVSPNKKYNWISKKDMYVLPQFCINCGLGRNDVILQPDGTVKAECCFLDFPIGHYKDFTLDKFEAKLNEMREMRDNGIDVRSK